MQQLKALPSRHIFPQVLATQSKINNCSLQAIFSTYSRLRDSSWENVPGWILEILLLCKNLQLEKPGQNMIQYLHHADNNIPGQNSLDMQIIENLKRKTGLKYKCSIKVEFLNVLCFFPWAIGIAFIREQNALHQSESGCGLETVTQDVM